MPIDHFTHVPFPVDKYSAESEYNVACTAVMDTEYFRIINNDLLNKDTYAVPEQAHLIILDNKSSVCMDKNYKDTKHTRHISR